MLNASISNSNSIITTDNYYITYLSKYLTCVYLYNYNSAFGIQLLNYINIYVCRYYINLI